MLPSARELAGVQFGFKFAKSTTCTVTSVNDTSVNHEDNETLPRKRARLDDKKTGSLVRPKPPPTRDVEVKTSTAENAETRFGPSSHPNLSESGYCTFQGAVPVASSHDGSPVEIAQSSTSLHAHKSNQRSRRRVRSPNVKEREPNASVTAGHGRVKQIPQPKQSQVNKSDVNERQSSNRQVKEPKDERNNNLDQVLAQEQEYHQGKRRRGRPRKNKDTQVPTTISRKKRSCLAKEDPIYIEQQTNSESCNLIEENAATHTPEPKHARSTDASCTDSYETTARSKTSRRKPAAPTLRQVSQRVQETEDTFEKPQAQPNGAIGMNNADDLSGKAQELQALNDESKSTTRQSRKTKKKVETIDQIGPTNSTKTNRSESDPDGANCTNINPPTDLHTSFSATTTRRIPETQQPGHIESDHPPPKQTKRSRSIRVNDDAEEPSQTRDKLTTQEDKLGLPCEDQPPTHPRSPKKDQPTNDQDLQPGVSSPKLIQDTAKPLRRPPLTERPNGAVAARPFPKFKLAQKRRQVITVEDEENDGSDLGTIMSRVGVRVPKSLMLGGKGRSKERA